MDLSQQSDVFVFNTLSRFVITFLPRFNRLPISCLQSPSTGNLEPRMWWREWTEKRARTEGLAAVQSLSRVQFFATSWTAARQASLSITSSRSLLKLMSIELVMLSSHLILCHPLLLPWIFPSIRVFSSETALGITWPKGWSFSFSISPPSEYSGLISFRMSWLVGSLQFEGLSRVFSNTTIQKHQFFCAQLSL